MKVTETYQNCGSHENVMMTKGDAMNLVMREYCDYEKQETGLCTTVQTPSGRGVCHGVRYNLEKDRKIGRIESNYQGSRIGDIMQAKDGTYYFNWCYVGLQTWGGAVVTESFVTLLEEVENECYESFTPSFLY